MTDIGIKVGRSRERVRQILKNEGLPTLRYKQRLFICQNCESEYDIKNNDYKSKIFCSAKCRWEYSNPLVICDWCGGLFRRRIGALTHKRMKHTHYYCSKYCQGKYLGFTYGFKINHRKGLRYGIKYPLECRKKMFDLRDMGFSYKKISQELDIPESIIGLYLMKYKHEFRVSGTQSTENGDKHE